MIEELNPQSTPLVTLGITCYNAEGTIKNAINSAVAQSWPNCEIIVCDDNSTDSSLEILNSLKKQFPHIKLIQKKENGGPASSRNIILSNAIGKYIVFFDDDDISHVKRVEEQIKLLETYKQKHKNTLLLCYASGVRKYASGYVMRVNAVGSCPSPPRGLQIVDYLLFNNQIPGVFYGGGTPACSLAMSTSDLVQLGGFDEDYRRVEDADLAIRAGHRGALFIGCKQELYTQYSTYGSDKTPIKNYEAELLLVEKNAIYLKKIGMYSYAKNWTKLRFYYFNRDAKQFLLCLALLLIDHPIVASKHFMRSSIRRFIHEIKCNWSI
jgi:glycosyltransferase involved in cell wall biosynthesis